MTATTLYKQVEAKRKNWTPVNPTKTEYTTLGTEDLISRALTMRSLELPVKDFILDGLSKQEASVIGDDGFDALMRNTADEERHDIALTNCVNVNGSYSNKYESEVENMLNAVINHPDNPITKAAVLENGIFFLILPLFRRFGGEALRTTSVDISADEINHVQTHRYAAKQMGYKPSKSLDTLRKDIVDWIVNGFSFEELTADKLRSASNNLMYKGIAPELNFTQSFQVPAFFEKRNDVLPKY